MYRLHTLPDEILYIIIEYIGVSIFILRISKIHINLNNVINTYLDNKICEKNATNDIGIKFFFLNNLTRSKKCYICNDILEDKYFYRCCNIYICKKHKIKCPVCNVVCYKCFKDIQYDNYHIYNNKIYCNLCSKKTSCGNYNYNTYECIICKNIYCYENCSKCYKSVEDICMTCAYKKTLRELRCNICKKLKLGFRCTACEKKICFRCVYTFKCKIMNGVHTIKLYGKYCGLYHNIYNQVKL